MDDITPLRSLRLVLAALYPAIADSQVVLADADIATQRIAFDPAAETQRMIKELLIAPYIPSTSESSLRCPP